MGYALAVALMLSGAYVVWASVQGMPAPIPIA
jgi:hypothetical protein